MKSKYIPANLDLSQRAIDLVKDEINVLNQLTATRKNRSLNNDINQERLQYLLYMDHLNEDQMARFGVLLDPQKFSEEASAIKKSLKEHKKDELAKILAETQLKLAIERGYGEVAERPKAPVC